MKEDKTYADTESAYAMHGAKLHTLEFDYKRILQSLQEIRETAWQNAVKYRFDPVVGATHYDYLKKLNGLLESA